MAAAVVLSLGSINADFQVRVDSLRDFGRGTPAGRDLARLSGGKAANVAVVARRLGCQARLLGRVGNDDLAGQALAPLRAEGIDLGGVRQATGTQTGMAFLAVGPDGDKRTAAAGEANLGFGAVDVEAVAAAVGSAPSGSVLAADYEITPHAVSRAIAAARQRGLAVVVDPSFPHQVQRGDLAGVAALTPNEREARVLAGLGSGAAMGDVARALAALGPQLVCIKLKGGGCLFVHQGQSWHQPAAPVHVVDTSGAGDAFTGALAVALAEGRDARQAVLWAVAATELAVAAYGAQPSYPERSRLEAQLRGANRQPATIVTRAAERRTGAGPGP